MLSGCRLATQDDIGWKGSVLFRHGGLTHIIAAKFLHPGGGDEGSEGLTGIDLTGRSDGLDARGAADVGSNVSGVLGYGVTAGIHRARVQTDAKAQSGQAMLGPVGVADGIA